MTNESPEQPAEHGADPEPDNPAAFQVRRIVTGHNEEGQGVIVSDEVMDAHSRGDGEGINGCDIWSTESMPIDNSTPFDATQRAGYVKHYNYVGSGQGTVVRIVEWSPGHAYFPHRTLTLDYSILLSGEIDVLLDSNQVVHMKAGDVIVMRGVTHTWINRSERPAVTAFVLLDAQPIETNGQTTLEPLYPAHLAIN
jgi:quercetin dioxygenase-like cupin family protein